MTAELLKQHRVSPCLYRKDENMIYIDDCGSWGYLEIKIELPTPERQTYKVIENTNCSGAIMGASPPTEHAEFFDTLQEALDCAFGTEAYVYCAMHRCKNCNRLRKEGNRLKNEDLLNGKKRPQNESDKRGHRLMSQCQ